MSELNRIPEPDSGDTLLNPQMLWAAPPRRRQIQANARHSSAAAPLLKLRFGPSGASVGRFGGQSAGAPPRERSVPACFAPSGFRHSAKPAANRPGLSP